VKVEVKGRESWCKSTDDVLYLACTRLPRYYDISLHIRVNSTQYVALIL
jgi:hypothetical protein